jgi:hypothetical protein
MNSSLRVQPSITQLNRLIRLVPAYPITISRLLDIAKSTRQPKEVVNFYENFDHDQVFDNSDDLQGRSEQVEIMRESEKDMPREWEFAPEEY